MSKFKLYILFFFVVLATSSFVFAPEWGFFGHRRINRSAVFTLPPEMVGFYKEHIEYVTEHAVDPDKRRYASKHEAVRHYIDLDHWGAYPFDEVPRNWVDALMKFTNVHVVTAANDTLVLKQPFYQPDSLDAKRYRTFFKEKLLSIYYEEEWVLDCADVSALFDVPADCTKVYAEESFSSYGICPYNLVHMYRRLSRAFEANDEAKILRFSAEMGHYLGDAHVPLHTTENYNGQFTDQLGIHAFWESRLPELYADKTYNFFVGKAEYVDDPQDFFWDIILDSHVLLDSVLLIENDLRSSLSSDLLYCYEERGNQTIRMECQPFCKAYHDRLNGMVEDRMRAAIKALGSVWYSAWVDAGQPNLNKLNLRDLSNIEAKEQELLEKKYKEGDIKGRKH